MANKLYITLEKKKKKKAEGIKVWVIIEKGMVASSVIYYLESSSS